MLRSLLRLSPGTCVLIFATGWLAGVAFIFTVLYMGNLEELAPRSHTVSNAPHHNPNPNLSLLGGLLHASASATHRQAAHRAGGSSRGDERGNADASEQQREEEAEEVEEEVGGAGRGQDAEEPLGVPDPKGGGPNVWLDWPVDDRLLTLDNYRALESLLVLHPEARFTFLLPASADAYTQKIGNLVSVRHFGKYVRRGYALTVLPVTHKMRLATFRGSGAGGSSGSGVGIDAPVSTSSSSSSSSSSASSSRSNTTTATSSSPALAPRNANASLSPSFRYAQRHLTACCGACVGKCPLADHLQPFHLLMYIRLTFLYLHGGVFSDLSFLFLGPLDRALATQGYYLNSFCLPDDKMEVWQMEQSQEQWRSSRCHTSALLVFHDKRSPILECVLRKYAQDRFVACVEGDEVHGGAECLAEALRDCFALHNAFNDLLHGMRRVHIHTHARTHGAHAAAYKAPEPTLSSLALSPLETLGGDAGQASLVLAAAATSFSLQQHKRVLWLGAAAFTGAWPASRSPSGVLGSRKGANASASASANANANTTAAIATATATVSLFDWVVASLAPLLQPPLLRGASSTNANVSAAADNLTTAHNPNHNPSISGAAGGSIDSSPICSHYSTALPLFDRLKLPSATYGTGIEAQGACGAYI